MPIDAFIVFKERLTDVDYTDIFGERTKQLKEIRKDAFEELAKRLNSDVPPTDLEKEYEAAFFKDLKKKLGQEVKIGSMPYWENRIEAKRLSAMYNAWTDSIIARVSDWNEFLSKCNSCEKVLAALTRSHQAKI